MADEPRVVRIVVSGEPAITKALEAIVRELLGGQAVSLDWRRTSAIDPREVLARPLGGERVAVRAWLDLSDAKRARIYVANAGTERFVVRIVPLDRGYDEVAREALAHIVGSSVDAFLTGEDVGVTREVAERTIAAEPASTPAPTRPTAPTRPPTPAPTPSAEVRSDRRTLWSLSATTSALSEAPHLRSEVRAGWSHAAPIDRNLRAVVAAHLGYQGPVRWSTPSIGAGFEGGVFGVGGGLETRGSSALVFRALGGVAGELVRISPSGQGDAAGSTATPTTTTTAPFWIVAPLLWAGVFADARVVGRWRVMLGVGLDVDVAGHRYALERGGEATAVIVPWRFRPSGLLGLAYAFGGP